MWLWLQQNRILAPLLSVSGNCPRNTIICQHKWKSTFNVIILWFVVVFTVTAGPLQTWQEITLSSRCLHKAISMTCSSFGVQRMDLAYLSEMPRSSFPVWTTMWIGGIHFALRGTLCLEWVSYGWMENTPLGSTSPLVPTLVAPSSSF